MTISSILIYLIGVMESMALITLALVLVKAELNWKRITVIGIVLSSSAFLVRSLPITFGIHTIINTVLLIIFVNYFSRKGLTTAIIFSLTSVLILIISETLLYNIIAYLFNLPLYFQFDNSWLRVFISLPHIILLFLISYLLKANQHHQRRQKV